MAQPNAPIDFGGDAITPAAPPSADDLLPTEAAYQNVLCEILAVPESELTPVNIDVMAAITTVTGVLPEIRALRPEIEGVWRSFDFAQFDKLEQYTLALNHAHICYRSAIPGESVVEVATELSTLRDQLLANASSLSRLGLINAGRLKNVKKLSGYRALASDVLILCKVFKEAGGQLEGKTPFTQPELLRAGTLALALVNAVGLREQAPIVAGQATLIRQKAFTLFVRAYEEARRAVHYLRSKAGDGERIAPSLYAGRRSRRRQEEPHQEPPAPVLVASANAVASAPVANSEGTPGTPPTPIVIDNATHLPIDHPFIH